MRNLKLLIRILFSLLLIAILAPFALTYFSIEGGHYLNREMTYQTIANRFIIRSANPIEFTETINTYFFLNESRSPPFSTTLEHTAHSDLTRNIGWCDQKVVGLLHILERNDIEGNMVMFPCHTVAEIELNGTKLFIDPTYNTYFKLTKTNDLASLRSVLEESDSLLSNNGSEFSDYEGKSILDCGNYRLSQRLSESKSFKKKVLTKIVEFNMMLGSTFYVNTFQKFYFSEIERKGTKALPFLFSIHKAKSDSGNLNAEIDLYKARCMHLIGNYPAALKSYSKLVNDDIFIDEATFFKAKILLEENDIDEFFNLYKAIDSKYGETMSFYLNEAGKYNLNGSAQRLSKSENRAGLKLKADGQDILYFFILEDYVNKLKLLNKHQLAKFFDLNSKDASILKDRLKYMP